MNTPSAANIRRYAEVVRDRAVLRRLIQVSGEIAESALSPSGRETAQVLDEAETRIFQIAESGNRGKQGFVEIHPLQLPDRERVLGRFDAGFGHALELVG